MEEADRSPGQTVLGPDNQQLTLSRGMLNHLEGGGQATLIRGRKPVQVHSFIIDLIRLFNLIHLFHLLNLIHLVQVYSSLLAPATANTVMAEQDRTATGGLPGSGRRWCWEFFFEKFSFFPGGIFLS